jgi:hypothetical protein
MAEGLKPQEVAGELRRHQQETAGDEPGPSSEGAPTAEPDRRSDKVLSILEAALLAVVAVLAAYSGFASAKWGTESSLKLAQASAARNLANRADAEALSLRNFDASSFNAWFSAYVAGNTTGMTLAQRRFRPVMERAFVAWLGTDPATNPHAPPGPTYMPQYRLPQAAAANRYDATAEADYQAGADAGSNSDEYVRDTVYLATILFLVGISTQFRYARVRHALVAMGTVMLVLTAVLLLGQPSPP